MPRTWEQLENLRRSVAMLSTGQPALNREDALEVLAQLQEVISDLRGLEDGLRALLDRDGR